MDFRSLTAQLLNCSDYAPISRSQALLVQIQSGLKKPLQNLQGDFTDAAQIIDEQTLLYQFIGVFKLVVTIATRSSWDL